MLFVSVAGDDFLEMRVLPDYAIMSGLSPFECWNDTLDTNELTFFY